MPRENSRRWIRCSHTYQNIIRKKRWKYYGHVLRMDKNSTTGSSVLETGGKEGDEDRKQLSSERYSKKDVCLLVGCLMSQPHASVSKGRICTDNSTCCHIEIEVTNQTYYLTHSQYTETGPTSPSADPIMPGAWQGSHWSANFEVTGMTRPGKIPSPAGFEPRISRSRADALTTRPARL